MKYTVTFYRYRLWTLSMKNKIIDEILGLGGPGTKEDWKDKPMGELKDKLDELKDKHDMPPKDYPKKMPGFRSN